MDIILVTRIMNDARIFNENSKYIYQIIDTAWNIICGTVK